MLDESLDDRTCPVGVVEKVIADGRLEPDRETGGLALVFSSPVSAWWALAVLFVWHPRLLDTCLTSVCSLLSDKCPLLIGNLGIRDRFEWNLLAGRRASTGRDARG